MTSLTQERSNWGRWGKDDERGTLNLITPQVIQRASTLVKKGKTYTLSWPIVHTGYGVPHSVGRVPAIVAPSINKSKEGNGGGDDYITLNSHNQTHIDALSHRLKDHAMYNGWSEDFLTTHGAERCGVDKIGSIVTRGVLLDVAAYRRVEFMKRGEAIKAEEMRKVADWEGVKFESGDAILVRTGVPRNYDKKDNIEWFRGCPGLAMDAMDLLDDVGAALVGADNYCVEVEPSEIDTPERRYQAPLHEGLIWRRGMNLMEMMYLEPISADKVYEFLFMVAPLKIEMGMGSPINPVAVC